MLPHRNELKDIIRSLRINCYKYRSSLERNSEGAATSIPEVLDGLINEYIAKDLGEKTDVNNEEFWHGILDLGGFHQLQAIIRNYRIVYDDLTAGKRIRERRLQELEQRHFFIKCAPYYSASGQKFVLICDNVDALSSEAQIAVLNYATEFASKNSCKAIVTMRDHTWNHVGHIVDDHERKIIVKLRHPDLKAILDKRTQYFSQRISACYNDVPL